MRVESPAFALGAVGTRVSPLEYRIRRIVEPSSAVREISALPGFLALAMTLALRRRLFRPPPRHGCSAPPPRVLHPENAYPEFARENGIQGTVPVQVEIDRVRQCVNGATAIGGPKELRQAAVKSAVAHHFAPEPNESTERVNVAFKLDSPSITPPSATCSGPFARAHDTAFGPSSRPSWRDQGEYLIGAAASKEKDAAKQLELLKDWERQYPSTELKTQRTALKAARCSSRFSSQRGSKTDPAILDTARAAGLELAGNPGEYFNEDLRTSSQVTRSMGADALEFRVTAPSDSRLYRAG